MGTGAAVAAWATQKNKTTRASEATQLLKKDLGKKIGENNMANKNEIYEIG